MGCRVVQVTNIAPSATESNMREVFGIIGDYSDLKLYPSTKDTSKIKSRVCYVKYADEDTCLLAQHLTSTSLLERALIVVPVAADFLPDEATALAIAGDSIVAESPVAPAVAASAAQSRDSITTSVPTIMGMSLSQIVPVPGMNPIMQLLASTAIPNQLITGASSRAALNSELYAAIAELAPEVSDPPLPGQVPPAPTLGGSVDPSKIEEIRRTVYVGNLNSQVAGEALVPFFEARCGEVLYVRMAGDETQPTRFVFVEFSRPEAVNIALQYNGAMFGDRPLKVNHSKNAVVKPQVKTIEPVAHSAMDAARRAQADIGKEIDDRSRRRSGRSDSPRRRRSRSYSHSRSRSRDRSRHSRYSSRRGYDDRRRNRSRSRDRRDRRDRYRSSRRSRSRDRRRSPSDSPSRSSRRRRKASDSHSD